MFTRFVNARLGLGTKPSRRFGGTHGGSGPFPKRQDASQLRGAFYTRSAFRIGVSLTEMSHCQDKKKYFPEITTGKNKCKIRLKQPNFQKNREPLQFTIKSSYK